MSFQSQHEDLTSHHTDGTVLKTEDNPPVDDSLAANIFTANESSSLRIICITPVSLPSSARLSAHSINCCHSALSCIDATLSCSPTCSSPGTTPQSATYSQTPCIDHFGNDEELTAQSTELMRRRLVTACYAYFLCGWGDGVTGAVLPYFKRDYHLNYMTASLIFATSTIGFGIGTLSVERLVGILGRFYIHARERSFIPALPLVSRLFHINSSSRMRGATGHSKSQARVLILILSSLVHSCFFSIMGSKSGYATLLLAYSSGALARAYLTSTLNAYVSLTPRKPHGHLLGCWSFGAFASPFVCQTLITKGFPWQNFYFGSLVVSALNTCFLIYSFRPTRREFESDRRSALKLIHAAHPDLSHNLPAASGIRSRPSSVTIVDAPSPVNTLKCALSMTYQWVFSVFACIYSANETTTQGFMTTYLLVVRHADPKTVGYVTSGYWAGQTISRFMWGHYTPSLTFTQRKHIIHACIACMLIMHLLIWFVPSNIENAFSTSFVGFASGPLFPGTLRMVNDVLPSDLHMISMAMTSAFASFGSALFPFITGTISNVRGVHSLTYVTVAQSGVLFCLWSLFPSKKPLIAARI